MYKKKNTTFTIITVLMLMMLTLSVAPVGATKSPISDFQSVWATSTILVFDTSGSMRDPDSSGMTKMDAAIDAGYDIINVINAENESNLGSINEIGVVEFNRNARVVSPLTTSTSSTRSALNSLVADGGTAMPSGLKTALDLANTTASGSAPLIILLSDGVPNFNLSGDNDVASSRQQSLDLASEAGARGICIYTIGLGVPGTAGSFSGDASIDEAFLKEIAERSGCGKYYNAQNSADLAFMYLLSYHRFTGDLLFEGIGQITQGQQIIVTTIDIPANQERLLYTLQWPGSQLNPTAIDPTGKQVDMNYPGASFSTHSTLATIIVQNPIAGKWQFGAYGVSVPGGVLTYHAGISARQGILPQPTAIPPTPQPAPGRSYRDFNSGSLGILPYMVAIMLFSAVLIYYAKTKKSKSGAYLQVVNDPANARRIPLKDNFVIGRGSGSSLRLSDTTTSRQHTRFNYTNGVWTIQDLGSTGGTFVNGQRIQSQQLNNGDQIKIGQASFSFQQQ